MADPGSDPLGPDQVMEDGTEGETRQPNDMGPDEHGADKGNSWGRAANFEAFLLSGSFLG